MVRNLQADPRNRNVQLYDDDGALLGGLHNHGGSHITTQNFYDWVALFVRSAHSWRLFHLLSDGSTGQALTADQSQLPAGDFAVLANDGQPIPVSLTAATAPRRVPSHQQSSSRADETQVHLRGVLRARDSGCALSGAAPGPVVPFATLKVGHVFPVAREGRWIAQSCGNWITDNRSSSLIGASKIHSPQNGLLLDDTVHTAFDLFLISVVPEDGYKVVDFSSNYPQVHGRVLSSTATNPPNSIDRVSDNVLRWHFEQAVLSNMKGAGEKPWEFDLAGGNEVGAIMAEEDAAERIEVELFTRLGAGHTELLSRGTN